MPSALRLLNPDLAPTALIVLLTIGLVAYFTGPLTPDVSGQFWLAHAMRKGTRLYIDFLEINPPLWFWMAIPVDWLAETLGIRYESLVVLCIGLLTLMAVGASRRLLAGSDPTKLTLFLLYMVVILLVVPMYHLEQREHLAVLGAIPYLVLASRRRQGASIGPVIATFIGIGAGLGLALKPYFLTVAILPEIWLISSLRRSWRPIRPETAALASVGALYLLAVLLFTPRYLTYIVPHLFPLYDAGAPPLLRVIDIGPIIWLFMLLAIGTYWQAIWAGKAPLTIALLLGFFGFAYAYAAQHKPWLYQQIPAFSCLALALAATVMELGKPRGRLRLFLPALLLWVLGFPFTKVELSVTPSIDLRPAFSNLKDGDAFALVSTIGATTWQSTVDHGYINSSRYGAFWMLGSFDNRRRDPVVRQAMAQVASETVTDFHCLPPKVIVFTRFDRPNRYHHFVDDPYRFFMQYPAFAELLSHYRLTMRYGIFDVYEPATPLPQIDRHLCPRIR